MGLQTTSSAPVQMLDLFTLPDGSNHFAEKKGLKLTEVLDSGIFPLIQRMDIGVLRAG